MVPWVQAVQASSHPHLVHLNHFWPSLTELHLAKWGTWEEEMCSRHHLSPYCLENSSQKYLVALGEEGQEQVMEMMQGVDNHWALEVEGQGEDHPNQELKLMHLVLQQQVLLEQDFSKN